MNQIQYNQDGTINALYTTTDGALHHFAFPASNAYYGFNIDASSNIYMLNISTACTDPGCTFKISVSFPLIGDAVAQQVHCMYRYATAQPPITLQQAAQSVIDDVTSAGSTPRIDADGQVK